MDGHGARNWRHGLPEAFGVSTPKASVEEERRRGKQIRSVLMETSRSQTSHAGVVEAPACPSTVPDGLSEAIGVSSLKVSTAEE